MQKERLLFRLNKRPQFCIYKTHGRWMSSPDQGPLRVTNVELNNIPAVPPFPKNLYGVMAKIFLRRKSCISTETCDQ